MTATTSPAVQLSNLSKHFRNVTAVDRLSLEIPPGEVLALIGANGSGKSTTFRLMLNIYKASAGESTLLGVPSTKLNGRDFEDICYISESQKQPLWMRVEYFLQYCGKMYSGWDQDFCDKLTQTFGLPPKQKIKHLSRGQKMKLALASTLPCHPKLLFLDEPFSGLDVETRAQLGNLLKQLAQDNGLTTVLTTHDVEEVEPVASRIAILDHGRLIIDEALESFINRHRNIVIPGIPVEKYPEALASLLTPIEAIDGSREYHSDQYNAELEARIKSLLPDGEALQAEKMPLRKILSGKAVQL